MSNDAVSSKGWMDSTCNSMGFTLGFILLTDMWKYPRPLMIILAILITGFHLARFCRLYYYFTTDPTNFGKTMDFPIFMTRGIIFTLIAILQTRRFLKTIGPAPHARWIKFVVPALLIVGMGYTAFMGAYSGSVLLVASCKRNFYRYSYCVPVAKALSTLTNSYFSHEILLTSLLLILDLHFLYIVLLAILVKKEAATLKGAVLSFNPKGLVLVLSAFIPVFASVMNIAHVGDYLTGIYTYRGGGYNFEISFFALSIHILGLEFASLSKVDPVKYNNDSGGKPNASHISKVKKSEVIET